MKTSLFSICLPVFLGLTLILAQPSVAAPVWDGGGANNNTSTAENWDDNITPNATGEFVTFDGTLRLNVNNDLFTQVERITFAPGAGAFVIGGNGITLPSTAAVPDNTVVNNNVTHDQTIALNLNTGTTGLSGASGSHTVFSGTISGSNLWLARESGSGQAEITFSGSNSISSQTVVQGNVTLNLAHANALGTGNLRLNAGDSNFDNTSGGLLTIGNTIDFRNANTAFIGTHDLTTTGELFARQTAFAVNASTLTVGFLDTNQAGRNLAKQGAGTLVVNGAAGANFNASSVITVQAGALLVGHQDALGGSSLTLQNASFGAVSDLSGANGLDNPVTLAGNATIVGNDNLTFDGDFTQSGADRTLTNNSGGGATLNLAGNVFLSNDSGTGRTLTLAGSGHTVVSGDIQNFDGAGSVVVDTTGVVEFSGTNNYTGTTTVTAGTLLVNGDQSAATGDVNVAQGAVLTGTGTLGGATTISGSLRPGNSIGTFTVDNDVTWNGGDLWVFELGVPGNSDLLDITDGRFFQGTGTDFGFNFDGTGEEGLYTLAQWSSTEDLGGGALGTNFNLEDFSYTNLAGGLTGSFAFDGTSLQLSVIPEPSSAALIIGGAALFLGVRRRRDGRASL